MKWNGAKVFVLIKMKLKTKSNEYFFLGGKGVLVISRLAGLYLKAVLWCRLTEGVGPAMGEGLGGGGGCGKCKSKMSCLERKRMAVARIYERQEAIFLQRSNLNQRPTSVYAAVYEPLQDSPGLWCLLRPRQMWTDSKRCLERRERWGGVGVGEGWRGVDREGSWADGGALGGG